MSPKAHAVLERRRAGVLLHPTSLPGAGGNGTLGPEAFHFVAFLADCGASVWQVLPLGPPHDDLSPYQAQSVHAGDPRLIAPEPLVEAGWLDPQAAQASRETWLARAHCGFEAAAGAAEREAAAQFAARHRHWLEDYALFRALRAKHRGAPWWEWPARLRDRDPDALAKARRSLDSALARQRFEQFLFYRQWQALRCFANARGVQLFGDVPIFVAQDSAEVWAEREYFRLDRAGRPVVVAGTPPDYFSATGQYWGNPHYDWERMRGDDFRWWKARMATQLELFDLVRIDHFRGFEACWEIPAESPATEGRWVQAPGEALFESLERECGALPLVAEDLGHITPEVHALRERFGIPGMKVMQFAFGGGAENPYLPHNHVPNCVVYAGTHDNNTTLGWYRGLSAREREHVHDYLGDPPEAMPWPLVRAALASVGRMAVLTMQDLLGLDEAHRLNVPGVARGNWRWRFTWEMVPEEVPARVRHLVALYGREVAAGGGDEGEEGEG